ncbi:MAG: hypothetical protein Q9160_007050 [Pyrenula sp. 1 TL-2023]
MAGVKRPHDVSANVQDEPPSPYISMFEAFRSELDEHHDRRERIIKASRDITAQSKKIIFALQRASRLNSQLPPSIAKDVQIKLKAIHGLFQSVSPDLQGLNAWRYQRQISSGHQEYVEALSFQQYLELQKLLSLEDTAQSMPTDVPHTEAEDHLLGLFDLTGEMMRFAITSSASNGTLHGANNTTILSDLQSLRTYFERLDIGKNNHLAKEYDQKMKTMRNSVEKVENAAYGLIVRGSERPKGWVPDLPEGYRGETEAVR